MHLAALCLSAAARGCDGVWGGVGTACNLAGRAQDQGQQVVLLVWPEDASAPCAHHHPRTPALTRASTHARQVKTNFPVAKYADLLGCMGSISLEELVMAVRRQSQVGGRRWGGRHEIYMQKLSGMS